MRLTSRAIVALLLGGLLATDARAGWPPTEGMTSADLADPANWPNDPDYGYSDDQSGQWNYWSFLPPQKTPGVLRPGETAAGMSIDLAWRHTIGDPSVRIMVTDSGIEWDAVDLLDKVWLNDAELAGHHPLHADASACGGEGALAGFDCNGDGVLTVSDYGETPGFGDRNQNGHLDGGDVILAFSDGVDDDDNGFVDDIAGWDFFKDDNDPYDDTRYGHGTFEAHQSTDAANNGIGEAGACPRCRFVPARIGDSFIADVTAHAKAILYAADMGVPIVQSATGGIDMTRFSQAALDYAYSKGTLVITAMADENERHHNFPATANHTLPVHAITIGGSTSTSAATFLAFNTCTNYGGQNLLSLAGTGCSSEATGELGGISGLVLSAAKKWSVDPALSVGELHQLFITTADDIDVPESHDPDSGYYWSQPGFDQRFGYGRVNANRAVEQVRDGKIPPSIDMTSPRWFTVLYRDHGPVPIEATVAAKRAGSYDVTVEWGPGVQPLDAEFVPFFHQENVDGATVLGEGAPLATLEVADLDTTHEPDRDSPHGENEHTITVRVRAVAHYGGTIGDVPAVMHRTYYVHDDPALAKGFPLDLGDSGEASPKLADIDGDGVRDLVYPTSGGALHVWRLGPDGPEELPGFPYLTGRADGLADPPAPGKPVYLAQAAYASGAIDPDLGREAFVQAPAVGDLDGDGSPEIVASTFPGTVHVVGADGKARPGWPKRLPDVPSCSLDPAAPTPAPCMSTASVLARGAFAAPVLVDLDQDDRLDVVQAAFDGKIYAWDAGGADLAGFPVEVHYEGDLSPEPPRNRVLTTPAAGDFNGDGVPDLLVGSNEKLGSGGFSGAIYLVDGRGTQAGPRPYLPNWPVTMTSLSILPLVSEGIPNSGVIGDFDGTLAAVAHGNASQPLILPADPGKQTLLSSTPPNAIPERDDPYHPGQKLDGVDPSSVFGPLSKAYQPNTMFPLFAQPSLGDMDQDGVIDVVTTGGSLNLAINLNAQGHPTALKGEHLLAMWSGKSGAMLPASPIVLEDFTFLNGQAIADVNGDDYPEVLTGTSGYLLHAYDACGREAAGFPKFTGQWILTTTAIGDLDGDGALELAAGTRNGWLYLWHLDTPADAIIAWESYHHDNRNTGNAATPLEQGDPARRAKAPLTVESCTEPAAPPELDALMALGRRSGGAVGGGGGGGRGGLALAGLALVSAAASACRRRRSRSPRSAPDRASRGSAGACRGGRGRSRT